MCSGSLYHSELGDDVRYSHSSDPFQLIRAAVDRRDRPIVGGRRCSVVIQVLGYRILLGGGGLVVVWRCNVALWGAAAFGLGAAHYFMHVI